jgi:hypothetical protein
LSVHETAEETAGNDEKRAGRVVFALEREHPVPLSFIERCSDELTTFQGVVNQISKSSVMIHDETFLVSSSEFPLTSTLAIEVSEFYDTRRSASYT